MPKLDYLKKQREKRQRSQKYRSKFNWETIINDCKLNSVEKCKRIINNAKQIDTVAVTQEKIMRWKRRET